MVHTLLLGLQVAQVVLIGGDDDRHDLVDLQPVALQPCALERVVGHQPHVLDAHFADDARPDAVVAFVDAEAQPDVGVDRVEPFVLELVSFDFIAEADAASLLLEVDDGTLALPFDHAHRLVQLVAAVAAARAEDVARGARRMHARQHRFVFRPLAFGERHVLQPVALLPERRDAEVAPCGRQVDGLALLDDGFFAQPVFDERCDRNDLEAELPGDLRQLRQARHRAVLVHDLDQCACGLQAGQPGEVYRGLGMPRTAQHAFLAGTQRVDVPRAAEVGGPGRGVGQGAYGGGAVVDRDARGAAVAEQVDRHGEGRAQQRSVVLFHHVEPQFGAPLL